MQTVTAGISSVYNDFRIRNYHPITAHNHLIEVQFPDLRAIGDQVTDLGDDLGECDDVRLPLSPESQEHFPGLEFLQHLVCVILGDGSDAEGGIFEKLGVDAAETDHHQMSEVCVLDCADDELVAGREKLLEDRKSTRLNSSHSSIF